MAQNLNMYFFAALAVLIAALVWAATRMRSRARRSRAFTPLNILTAGVLTSAMLLFIPMYFSNAAHNAPDIAQNASLRAFNSILLAVHSAIRFFIVENDFVVVEQNVSGAIAPYYGNFVLFLMVLAPMLTFGFVISFFKNISAYAAYLLAFFRNTYVFSSLNERSITLAADIKANHPRAAIVFADSFRVHDDEHRSLNAEAREMGAICFKKEIGAIDFSLHSAKRELYFFMMTDDETANLTEGLKVFEKYGRRPLSNLFVFTESAESEVFFSGAVDGGDGEFKMKVRRINPIRSLVLRTLYDDGLSLFEHAKPMPDGRKKIGAVVVGMGAYGRNMVSSLAWFCQMDGYSLQIDAFDRDPLAEDRFVGSCPELMDAAHNGVKISGEPEYDIRIHSGLEVGAASFNEQIEKMKDATYVLVALGSDDENLRAALQMRMLFERIGAKPVIQAVMYSSERKRAVSGRHNFRGQAYDIDYIGDLDSFYTERVIIDSELERDALKRHMKYGREEDFWVYEYNYRSSVAVAVHAKMRRLLGIEGADAEPEQLTQAQRHSIELIEHRRWNAYMRSEGYVYSGSTDRATRNDLGRMHYDLVPFEELTEEEKRKDSAVGSA